MGLSYRSFYPLLLHHHHRRLQMLMSPRFSHPPGSGNSPKQTVAALRYADADALRCSCFAFFFSCLLTLPSHACLPFSECSDDTGRDLYQASSRAAQTQLEKGCHSHAQVRVLHSATKKERILHSLREGERKPKEPSRSHSLVRRATDLSSSVLICLSQPAQ